MVALILILAFPLITAVGFGILHLSTWSDRQGAGGGMESMAAYTVMLSLPVGAVIATLVTTDTGFADIGLPWPGDPSLLLHAGLSLLVGGATGALAFLADRALQAHTHPQTASAASNEKTELRYLNGGGSANAQTGADASETNTPSDAHPADERRPVSLFLPVVACAAVIGEEIAWRGYLLLFFCGVLGFHWATGLMLSAAAFGLNHYYFGMREIMAKSVLGLLWGGLLLATGSLLAPIASHLAFNALALGIRIEWNGSSTGATEPPPQNR